MTNKTSPSSEDVLKNISYCIHNEAKHYLGDDVKEAISLAIKETKLRCEKELIEQQKTCYANGFKDAKKEVKKKVVEERGRLINKSNDEFKEHKIGATENVWFIEGVEQLADNILIRSVRE